MLSGPSGVVTPHGAAAGDEQRPQVDAPEEEDALARARREARFDEEGEYRVFRELLEGKKTRYVSRVMYDGTNYKGFQLQNNGLPTVQVGARGGSLQQTRQPNRVRLRNLRSMRHWLEGFVALGLLLTTVRSQRVLCAIKPLGSATHVITPPVRQTSVRIEASPATTHILKPAGRKAAVCVCLVALAYVPCLKRHLLVDFCIHQSERKTRYEQNRPVMQPSRQETLLCMVTHL